MSVVVPIVAVLVYSTSGQSDKPLRHLPTPVKGKCHLPEPSHMLSTTQKDL